MSRGKSQYSEHHCLYGARYICTRTLALLRSSACAALTLSAFPCQAWSTEACRARPYEKVSAQGRFMSPTLLMAFRWTVASSSLCPPDRKVMPGTAAGTVLLRAWTVAIATCAGVNLTAEDWPAVTMLGLSRVPSRKTWWSARALYTNAKT